MKNFTTEESFPLPYLVMVFYLSLPLSNKSPYLLVPIVFLKEIVKMFVLHLKVKNKIFIRFGDLGYRDLFNLAKIISELAMPLQILYDTTE